MASVPEQTKVGEVDDNDDGAAGVQNDASKDVDNSDQVDKDGWLHLMEGTIKKRVVKAGSGQNPDMNQDVRCSFRVRLATGPEDVFLQVHENIRYRIGEGEAVPCLELCLRHMEEGEESEVWSVSRMAWGPEGLLAGGVAGEMDVAADADVVLRVVLHECLPSGTSWNDRVEELRWRKENGNNYFRRRQLAKAKKSYAAGLDMCKGDFEAPEDVPDAEAASAGLAAIACDIAANLAAAHLEFGDPMGARDAATVALSINADHVKALYRGAKACFLLDEFEECEVALQKALGLEPENASLLRLDADFKRKKLKYANKSKRLAEKAVKAFQCDDQEVPVGNKESNGQDLGRWIRNRWRYLAAASVILALLLVSMALVPRSHWRYCWISAIHVFLVTCAVLSRFIESPDVGKKLA